jgi:ethylbenzene dioxygenase beta subunit
MSATTDARKTDYARCPTLDRDQARQAAKDLLAMTGAGRPVDPLLHFAIERFYRAEARLLDEERLDEWYTLLADDLFYWMPLHENRFRRDKRSLFDPDSMALFDERKGDIAVRLGRLASNLVWSEDPPTRRIYIISNVEAFMTDVVDEYEVHSAFVQYRNRSEHDEAMLCGRRRDLLRAVGEGFQIARRLILLPQSILLTKNLSAFF